MRERDEHRLVLARRDVDPAFEEVAEERRVAAGVGPLRVVEVPHLVVRLEQRRHRADALHAAVRREPGLQARAATLQLLVDRRILQAPDYSEAGRGCERISRQRSGLVHVTGRRDPIHDLGAAAERRERQTAAAILPRIVRSGRTP